MDAPRFFALRLKRKLNCCFLQKENPEFNGSTMNWVFLSFAVITPMSASIGMAFVRRDQALFHLATLKATLLNLYSANACWDWPKPLRAKEASGRVLSKVDWLAHSDMALELILKLNTELTRMLTLPTCSRARHRVTTSGMNEASEISSLMFKLHRLILLRMSKLTELIEILEREGLPPNTASRLRQWERLATEKLGTFIQCLLF